MVQHDQEKEDFLQHFCGWLCVRCAENVLRGLFVQWASVRYSWLFAILHWKCFWTKLTERMKEVDIDADNFFRTFFTFLLNKRIFIRFYSTIDYSYWRPIGPASTHFKKRLYYNNIWKYINIIFNKRLYLIILIWYKRNGVFV